MDISIQRRGVDLQQSQAQRSSSVRSGEFASVLDQMRPHIRFFINGEQEFDLKRSLCPTDAVTIVQALSGG